MVLSMTELTQEQLKSALHYNPETGGFTRLISTSSRANVGDIAGTVMSIGYIEIMVKNKKYYAHRLAVLYMTGKWPSNQVDHINRTRDDNRWCNIRESNQSENCGNSSLRKDNTSGFKGVSWYNRDKKWEAGIMFKYKHIYLGRYKEKKDAAMAYNDKATELFGEFACLNEIN